MTGYPGTDWPWWIGGTALGVFGLVLMWWALLHDRAKGRRRCPKCWYDMTGSPILRCPECGHLAKRERKLFTTRRRWRLAVAAVVIMGAGYAGYVKPRVQQVGWLGAVPTTMIILGVDWIGAPSYELTWQLNDRLFGAQMWGWQRAWLVRKSAAILQTAPESSERAWAASLLISLAQHGPEATRAVPILLGALEDDDGLVRMNAAFALAILATDAESTVPALVPLLNDSVQATRSSAAWGLGRLGPDAQSALPALIDALGDEDKDVRFTVADAICKIASDPAPAIPTLVEVLEQPAWIRRFNAARTLYELGPKASAALPALIKALGDENREVRVKVIEALANIGPNAKAAAPSLVELLEDSDEAVRAAAAEALRAIRGEE